MLFVYVTRGCVATAVSIALTTMHGPCVYTHMRLNSIAVRASNIHTHNTIQFSDLPVHYQQLTDCYM